MSSVKEKKICELPDRNAGGYPDPTLPPTHHVALGESL